ncbi:uncharacterized protein LOC141528713 [Cotesia typhae]|uniref:uncharacterized protein LOC141528713 n=1 Tax=Cotesia typhae TaxID=2053667 RepID=UPI003D683C2F
MLAISDIRKDFVYITLSPMALMFPSVNWRFMYDWMKIDEQKNQKKEASTSEDKIWTSVASTLVYESENLPHMNGSKCKCCPATVDTEIPNFIDSRLPTYEELYPKLYEIHERLIDIEAGEPVQIDVPKNKFDKLIKTYSLQQNDNVSNCMKILGPGLLYLIIIVTIVTTSSFGLYYYYYPYF